MDEVQVGGEPVTTRSYNSSSRTRVSYGQEQPSRRTEEEIDVVTS